jgi:flagellar biosynthetic protein FliR
MLPIPADIKEVATILLIFGRFGGVMAAAPVLSNRHLPARIKIAFSLLVGFALAPLYRTAEIPTNASALALAMVGEVLIGLAIGFVAGLAFMAVHVAGEMADVSIGFTMATQYNPALGVHAPVLTQLQTTLAALLFLGMDGHHTVLTATADSIKLLPLGSVLPASSALRCVDLVAGLFSVGVRMALPTVASLVIADAALALLARTAPQINLFTVGVPVKMGVGLLVVMIGLPVLVSLTAETLHAVGRQIAFLVAR